MTFQKGHIPWSKNQKGVTLNSGRTHFKKGMIPWNKGKSHLKGEDHPMFGKIHSIEARKKISESGKGRAPWNKGLRGFLAGEKHYNWTGGSGSLRHQAMQKLDYRLWREAVFKRDNYTCQMCGDKGVYLEADHIKSWAEYPELRYAIDNGRTLCKPCHITTDSFPKQLIPKILRGLD